LLKIFSILAIKFPWDEDSSEHNSSDKNSIFPFHFHKNLSHSHNKNSSKFGSHGGPNKTHLGHGGLDVDFYNIFTSFVNQTRETIPDIAHHGNFTLIQLGLLCAIGAMAAGVSLVAAEGFAFRNHETEVEKYKYYKHLLEEQSHHPAASYGPPSTSYGVPMSRQDSSDLKRKRNRFKRQTEDEDSGELQFHHEIVKPYSSISTSAGTRSSNKNKNNPQLHTNTDPNFPKNSQIPQYPVYSLMYNSPYMANTAFQLAQLQQSYPFPENNPHHRRHGVDKIRRKFQELSSDAEFSRGIPLYGNNPDLEFRKESRKKKKRLREEFPLEFPEDVKVHRRKLRRRKDENV